MKEQTFSADLSGKVALITGSTRGLGREMALGLARCRADVVVVGRRIETCEQVASEIEALGRVALPYACHLGHWDEIDGLVATAWTTFGHVDIVVNNAGISPLYGSLETVSEELFDKVIGVNMKGPFRLMALAGSRMAAGAGGSIVNISSNAVRHPSEGVAPYAAAKAGLEALTVAFAEAFGPRVRVNCIQCGVFHTSLTRTWSRSEQFEEAARRDVALQRAAEPSEIVGTALYLASDASSFTSGAIIRVDGGAR